MAASVIIKGPNYTGGVGIIDVTRNGKPEATLHAEKRYYSVARSMMTEAAIWLFCEQLSTQAVILRDQDVVSRCRSTLETNHPTLQISSIVAHSVSNSKSLKLDI